MHIFLYNNCGASPTSYEIPIDIVDGRSSGSESYLLVYPNPVDDVLNIEIDAEFAQALLPSEVRSSLTFDVRLIDGQGTLLRQQKTKGGTVQFNVANLPNGLYYLHVFDGVNQTPQMQQIVIEH